MDNEFETKLIDLLNQFQYDKKLIEDITNFFQHTGKEKEFLTKFTTALRILSQYGVKAITIKGKMFEKLKNNKELFSIRLKGKDFNYRIIYSFLPTGTILIHGFEEKAGKKQTDYTKGVKTAKMRMKEM